MSRFKSLLLLLAVAAEMPLASATVTYAVGSCQPKLHSFTTIMGALGAAPAPNVVKICPGNYPEQIEITYPVTLEGISANNSAQATISVPSGGLLTNVNTSTDQWPAAAQVLVENVSGEVNFSNLTVDGTNNNVACTSVSCPWIVGIFYQGSPGTVNHLTIQNQSGHLSGVGVWLEGGSANPTVTVENSNLRGFDCFGINEEDVIVSGMFTGPITANIQGNYVTSAVVPSYFLSIGLFLSSGTVSVTGNLIAAPQGMFLGNGAGVTGPVSKNTIIGGQNGIVDLNCCVQITSNAIYNSGGTGIATFASTSENPVTGNTIVQSSLAIDFSCSAGNNVHSNTILGAATGIGYVPSGVVSTDTYYNVGTVKTTGTIVNGYCQ